MLEKRAWLLDAALAQVPLARVLHHSSDCHNQSWRSGLYKWCALIQLGSHRLAVKWGRDEGDGELLLGEVMLQHLNIVPRRAIIPYVAWGYRDHAERGSWFYTVQLAAGELDAVFLYEFETTRRRLQRLLDDDDLHPGNLGSWRGTTRALDWGDAASDAHREVVEQHISSMREAA